MEGITNHHHPHGVRAHTYTHTSINLGEGPHPHPPAEVDVPSDRGRSDVVPVFVVGCQLLRLARLDVVHIVGQLGLRASPGDGGRGGEGRGDVLHSPHSCP